ncbi:MAG: tRNA 2-thiouridine(34) synthase MnmA [Candidatus Adiutrix sp.]|jgi:tRNA-specific 2-thiouridylase|nr:tRNA 2-thiouridine(34) synthase MnmA [Candidatus Adiutrix sp.]
MGKKVLVGLSGGVDSAVAALTLLESGYEVVAARMKVYSGPGQPGLLSGCYGRDDAEDLASAAAMARRLGLPFREIDCSAAYRELVMDYFRAEYLAGRTPNPCVRCNQTVKFGAFLEAVRAQCGPNSAEPCGHHRSCDGERPLWGFDFFATGHYARIEADPISGEPTLKRGRDPKKDQSYFLYRLSREQLARTLFPLGAMTKEEVRRRAAEHGLAVHDRPDSQDFYGGDYADLLGEPDRPGNILDSAGRVLGRHRGFWRYTPGQRRGLGVTGPAPLYVLSINAKRNEVVVGPAEENAFPGCLLADTNFLQPEPEPGTRLMARMRSSQPLKEVIVGSRDAEGRLAVEFVQPMSGLAPGQSLVLYRDDAVVGGGVIGISA